MKNWTEGIDEIIEHLLNEKCSRCLSFREKREVEETWKNEELCDFCISEVENGIPIKGLDLAERRDKFWAPNLEKFKRLEMDRRDIQFQLTQQSPLDEMRCSSCDKFPCAYKSAIDRRSGIK